MTTHGIESPDPLDTEESRAYMDALVNGADSRELWKTRDGFVCRIKDMSDLHLLSCFTMMCNDARAKIGDEDMEAIPTTFEQIVKVMTSERWYRAFLAMRKELQCRGILGMIFPETF